MNWRVESRTSRSSSVSRESYCMKSTPRNLMAGMMRLLEDPKPDVEAGFAGPAAHAGGQTYDGSRAKHAGQRERNRLTLRSEQTLQTRDPSRSRAFQPRDMVSRFFSPMFLKYSFLTTCGTGVASRARKILSRKDLRVKSSRIRT